MKKIYPKRVNPSTMLTRFQEICKPIGLKVQSHSILHEIPQIS